MEKEIKTIDEAKGIVRVTTLDERWYSKATIDKVTGLPTYDYFPSATWIANYYPKGIQYFKWLASKGWDESQAIMESAGEKGTRVHKATELLEKGSQIPIDMTLPDRLGVEKELTTEEVACILSFKTFFELVKPEVLASEITVFCPDCAGTIDSIWRVKKDIKVGYDSTMTKGIWIIDKKTSQYIWESSKIQLSIYNEAEIPYNSMYISEEEWKNRKLAILGLGNKRTKSGYKFTEIPYKPKMVQVAKDIWANENPKAKPKQRDLPLVIKIEGV